MRFRTRLLSSVGLATALLLPPLHSQTDTVDEASIVALVAGYTMEIKPGLQTMGIPVLRPQVFSGTVAANDLDSISIFTPTGTSLNIGSKLTTGQPYFLEVTRKPEGSEDDVHVGLRFDLDVAATIAAGDNSIVVDISSPYNTIYATLPAGLDGYLISVRPHITLSFIFGSGSSAKLPVGDTVTMINPSTGAIEDFFLTAPPRQTVRWTKSGSTGNFDQQPIAPGQGLIINSAVSSPISLVIAGDVRRNLFVQPLKAGFNLLSEAYPLNFAPIGNSTVPSRLMTSTLGFTAASGTTQGDTFTLISDGQILDYFYRVPPRQTTANWFDSGSPAQNVSQSTLLLFNRGVLLNLQQDIEDYYIERPF